MTDCLFYFAYQFPEKHNTKVSVNDIVIKAVAVALKNVPEANGKLCAVSILVMRLLTIILGSSTKLLAEYEDNYFYI